MAIRHSTPADLSFTPLGKIAWDAGHDGDASDLAFVPSGTGAISRTVQAKERDIVSVKDFGAVADGVTDNTTAILNAINAVVSTSYPGRLYFPGSSLPYLTHGIKLTAANKQIIFSGDGPLASRIRFTTANADGHALSFAATDNSWGGLRNIGLECAASVTAVLYVLNPNNLFFVDRVLLCGGIDVASTANATHALYADESGAGGSYLACNGLYTTSLAGFNFYFNGQQAQAAFNITGGNHDVGPSGFINVVSTSNGPLITIADVRAEGVAGKDFIQYATTSQGRLSVHGLVISGGAANSIIRVKSGTAPWWFLDARYQTDPTNLYVDDVTPSLSWTFVTGDNANPVMSPIVPSYLYSGHNRMWVSNADGLLRTKNGGAPSSVTDGMVIGGGFASMAYGTTVFPTATVGTVQEVIPTDGVGYTLGNPLGTASVLAGQRITIRVKNTFGVLGAMAFGTNYRIGAAWVQPANGFSRSITFNSNALNIWTEESRNAADVTN